jgi:galactokinase
VTPQWGRLAGGVVRALADLGRPPVGADLEVRSNLSIGGGLSSSAAFEVAISCALIAAADWHLDPTDLALAAQRAEHLGSGVLCGMQDQMTSVHGGVFLLDCRTLVITPLHLPDELRVVIIDSGVARDLESSPWAQRRAESFAAAEALGLRVLRDATPEQVADVPRGRHAVHEMQRVWAFADAMQAGAVDALGPLMLASHASSRDDMECSIPALDQLVDCLIDAGAIGARLTGGGFGGCCVALVSAGNADAIADAAADDYRARTGNTPAVIIARAAPGVSEIA